MNDKTDVKIAVNATPLLRIASAVLVLGVIWTLPFWGELADSMIRFFGQGIRSIWELHINLPLVLDNPLIHLIIALATFVSHLVVSIVASLVIFIFLNGWLILAKFSLFGKCNLFPLRERTTFYVTIFLVSLALIIILAAAQNRI